MPRVTPRELISVKKEKDIRFLTVVSSLTRGGTERAAMNYALGYQRAGYPSAILAYNGGGPRRAQLEEAGVTPVERPIAWADPADLPDVHVDLAALDEDLGKADDKVRDTTALRNDR